MAGALNKSDVANAISSDIGVGAQLVRNVLTSLADLAGDELAEGNDFTVPGIVSIKFAYRGKMAKGAKYKKGDTYTGFGGVEQVAEADSKPVTERVSVKAALVGEARKSKPGTKPEAQSAFLKSKAGKAVKSRLAK